MTLNGLRFAQMLGLDASVQWGRRSLYYDTGEEENAWNTFFEQSRFSFSNHNNFGPTFRIAYYPDANSFKPYSNHTIRSSVHLALQSWCRPKAHILTTVEDFAAQHFEGIEPIGVHIRLTDAAAGMEGRSPATVAEFVAATRYTLRDVGERKIFLATDDEGALASFRAEFGELVVFQDVMRSSDGRSIHGHYDSGVNGSGSHKGTQVLVDALLLAKSIRLIRTHSRVTAYVLCLKPDLPFIDLDRFAGRPNHLPWLESEREISACVPTMSPSLYRDDK